MNNDKIELAWNLVENTGANVFITGKAGTGKTTFLRRLKEKSHKTIAVLAPTGIAALNAGGMTVHSFFQLSFSPYIPGIGQASDSTRFNKYSRRKLKVIRSIDTIVIDEISMVRADVLDAIDDKLRRYRNSSLPMGGVQLVMIGDVQQLPPVAREEDWQLLGKHYRSTYFFDSHVLQSAPYHTVELDKVYRQNDSGFLDILNAIRDNRADSRILEKLNSRYIPGFTPPEGERYIRLMTHNYQSQRLNSELMSALKTKSHTFTATIEGDFPELMYPADKDLVLKKGAQVMFIKNSSNPDHSYYNGLIGRVSDISGSSVTVETDDGASPIMVSPETWENTVYEIDEKENKMTEKVVGRFTQIPLRAAWAITIHKSQGLTFDKAIINAASAFAHGQTYVALSRCRSLEGLVLECPLQPSAVICDRAVSEFSDSCAAGQADSAVVSRLSTEFAQRLILDLADFTPLRDSMDSLHRAVQVSHGNSYPLMVNEFRERMVAFREVVDVSLRFQNQLLRMFAADAPSEEIAGRLAAASGYFSNQLAPLVAFVKEIPQDVDNKENYKKLTESLADVEYHVWLKEEMLKVAAERMPETEDILKIRSKAAARESEWIGKRASARKASRNSDLMNPLLYDRLSEWRRAKARETGVEEYRILGNRTLIAIANEMPSDSTDLLAIPGIGRKKNADYGSDLLRIVRDSV